MLYAENRFGVNGTGPTVVVQLEVNSALEREKDFSLRSK
jgi:hypothetical protein